jgi:hypothetical protein
MKPGDVYKCPECGADSFLKKESVMDGWTKKGEVLVCASCSRLVCDYITESECRASSPDDSVLKLASFLNTDEPEKIEIKADETDKSFCRDCIHFVSHPFMDRCSLHDKNVNPMDDCADFRKRE